MVQGIRKFVIINPNIVVDVWISATPSYPVPQFHSCQLVESTTWDTGQGTSCLSHSTDNSTLGAISSNKTMVVGVSEVLFAMHNR